MSEVSVAVVQSTLVGASKNQLSGSKRQPRTCRKKTGLYSLYLRLYLIISMKIGTIYETTS
jgi:hypothetical protein